MKKLALVLFVFGAWLAPLCFAWAQPACVPVQVLIDSEDVDKELPQAIDMCIRDYCRGKSIKVYKERLDQYGESLRRDISEQGLPDMLIYLALAESSLNPSAVSNAGAAGLWQLMPYIARKNGLVVNSIRDDRFDVEASTRAALTYLKIQYERFGSWGLAIAAYNSSSTPIKKAVEKYGTTNFYELMKPGKLPHESRWLAIRTISLAFVFECGCGFLDPPVDM